MTQYPPDPIEQELSEPGIPPVAGLRAKAAARGAVAAQLVAAGIFLSRIAGFIRQGVFSNYFGTSGSADAFTAALRMPNVLQNLLGEGVLSASFIPVYSELVEQGRKEEAGRVAGSIFALLTAVAGALALIGFLLAPVLVRIFTTGFYTDRFIDGRYDLTVALVRIIFPMTGILVMSAWALGVLNSHRRFFVPYVAPVLWNAAMIAALLIFGPRLATPSLAVALAWGALVGGALQFLIQLPWVLRVERSLKIRWDLKLAGVQTAVRNAGPAILGRGVVQLSGWLDLFLASFLVAGAVTVISYAQTLYVLPISLFGMSVAAAELPELARERGQTGEVLRTRVNRGLAQIAFFVVPSLVGYLLLGDVIAGALYERGRFDAYDTILVAMTLGAFSIGLVASTATRLFSSAFFALQDTKTPAKFAIVRVLFAAALGGGLMLLFDRYEIAPGKALGPVGLALGAGTAAWIEWWLLRRSLKPRIGAVGTGRRPLAAMFLAALVAGSAARAFDWLLPELSPLLTGLIVLPAYGVLYFLITSRLGLEQSNSVLRRIFGRLRRPAA